MLRLLVIAVLILIWSPGLKRCAAERKTENLILITIDGLRWQEVFTGADERLLNRQDGGVRDVAALRERFWAESPEERRALLMPFLWSKIARDGQLWGDVRASSLAVVTNGRNFSYPGYNEILSGFSDHRIDSNEKRPNANVTVLEWLNRKPEYKGRVAAFASWDVFPFILNEGRSELYVNAGWEELQEFANPIEREQWNRIAREVPRYWDNVRYDVFTFRGALEYMIEQSPRVLYVALGETDDWAHDGRYDLYLRAARRSDLYIQQLWERLQAIEQYRGKTSLVITTDHGRGDDRVGWKSHGAGLAGSEFIWIGVLGPDTPALRTRRDVKVTQAQIAATVAALLGEDFAAVDDRIANPLEGVIGTQLGDIND